MQTIFVDSNVPMYMLGAEHPNKTRAIATVRRLMMERAELVTDAEVYQEILHRYRSVGRLDAVSPVFDTLSQLAPQCFPVHREDIEEAAHLVSAYAGLSARDAVHVAVMRRQGISHLLSFDRGFDALPDVFRRE